MLSRMSGIEGQSLGDALLQDKKVRINLCELCDYRTTSIEALHGHQWRHARGELTSEIIQSKNKMVRAKKRHACPHCDYTSNLVGHVKRHILIHTGETPFECFHCDYKSRDKSTLRRHIERHSIESKSEKFRGAEGKKLECKKCNFFTSFKGALSRHLLRHKDPIICTHCNAQFWKQESYKNHILLHAGVALHSCKSCDYKTNVASSLANHVKRMHSEKSWVCPECNYSTRSPSDFSKHKTIHKSDRPYACDKCDYTGKRPSHLKVHLAIHDRSLKKYTCPFCDYRTMMIGSLKVHVRSHTGEKPYACNICGSTYTSRSGAKAHEYTHIKNWSQSCPHCDFKASQPRQFSRHLKTHKKTPGTVSSQKATSISTSAQKKANKYLKSDKEVKHEYKKTAVSSTGNDPFYETVESPSSVTPSPSDNVFTFKDFKSDPGEVFIKTEPEFTNPTHLQPDELVKSESIDIIYRVKEECNTV